MTMMRWSWEGSSNQEGKDNLKNRKKTPRKQGNCCWGRQDSTLQLTDFNIFVVKSIEFDFEAKKSLSKRLLLKKEQRVDWTRDWSCLLYLELCCCAWISSQWKRSLLIHSSLFLNFFSSCSFFSRWTHFLGRKISAEFVVDDVSFHLCMRSTWQVCWKKRHPLRKLSPEKSGFILREILDHWSQLSSSWNEKNAECFPPSPESIIHLRIYK